MRRRRPAAPASAVGAVVAALLAPVAPAVAVETLTADDLRRAGIVRLAELADLAPGWRTVSIDGFTRTSAPPGFPWTERPGVLVVVDDLPWDIDALGTTSLHRLPFGVGDIERAELDGRPGMHRGRYFPGGVIRLFTRRPAAPVEPRARHATGSETGDAGPWRYAGSDRPNVERIGFESSAGAGLRSGPAWADLGVLRARHYASDPRILDRYIALGDEDFRVLEKDAFAMRAGRAGERVDFSFVSAHSGIDEAFHLRAQGGEVPVENTLAAAGGFASFRRGDRFLVDASVLATSNELDATERGGVPALDFRREAFAGDVSVARRFSRGLARFGAGFEPRRAESRGRGVLQDASARRVFAAWEQGVRPGGFTRLDVTAERFRDDEAWAIAAAHERPLGARTTLEAAASAARALPEDSHPFLYWRDRGFTPLEDAGALVESDGPLRGARQASLDAGVRRELSARVRASAEVLLRSLRDVVIESRPPLSGDVAPAASPPAAFATEAHGEIAGLAVGIDADLGAAGRLRANAAYEGALGGTPDFRAAARRRPRAVASAEWTAAFRPGFETRWILRARSSATFDEYAPASVEPRDGTGPRVPGWTALDLAVGKWFAGRRARAGIAFRNILDRPVRTHPIGETEALALLVQVEWVR